MKHWLWRVTVAAVVTLSGMTGPAVSAETSPAPRADEWEIAVFLCTPSAYGCHKRYVTAKQRRDVETFLKTLPEVTEVRFVSRAAAYASFRREFAGQKKVLAGVRAKDLPESFRVRLSGVADRPRTRALANRQPGVGDAFDQAELHADDARPSPGYDMSVFLCKKGSWRPACQRGRGKANKSAVTAKEKQAILAAVKRVPGLISYEYEDQATAYRRFAESGANKELVAATRVSDMPVSYRLWIRPEADWDAPCRRLARMPGVEIAQNQRQLDREQRLAWEYGVQGPDISKGCV